MKTPSDPGSASSTGQWMATSVVNIERPSLGLVLTGGGARSAYQVGVLKGVAELMRRGSALPISHHHGHLRRRRERGRPGPRTQRTSGARCTGSNGCGAIFA